MESFCQVQTNIDDKLRERGYSWNILLWNLFDFKSATSTRGDYSAFYELLSQKNFNEQIIFFYKNTTLLETNKNVTFLMDALGCPKFFVVFRDQGK